MRGIVMNKKLIILLSCIAVMLIACQKNMAPTNDPENADENDVTETNDNTNKTPTVPKAALEKGDESADVQALQEALATLNYPLEATGTYDDMTTWAITDIQLQKDIQI